MLCRRTRRDGTGRVTRLVADLNALLLAPAAGQRTQDDPDRPFGEAYRPG